MARRGNNWDRQFRLVATVRESLLEKVPTFTCNLRTQRGKEENANVSEKELGPGREG